MTRLDLRAGLAAATFAGAILLGAGGAFAAPQILALIATDRPVAMRCDAMECRVELPTLCLQPERRAPETGRGYRLAEGQSVVLTGRAADGGVTSIPLDRDIRFEARRTHVAIEARIPRSLIARHGLMRPAIGVGPNVSVIPVAAAGDDRPVTAREIGDAVGPRRALATALIDRESDRMPAVRLTNRLINMLPGDGPADPALRRRLWSRILEDAVHDGIGEAALRHARFNVSLCAANAGKIFATDIRRCLQGFNGDTMEYLDTDLEKALKAGS